MEPLRERRELRDYLAANALWEASLSALKTFVFLFIVAGVGLSKPEASGIVVGVALGPLAGAPLSGWVGDRIGRLRLMLLVLPHGALTGFYSLSRGVGAALGPLAAGLAIQLLGHRGGPFASTQGYAAMWLVCGATVLASLWPTRALARAVDEG